MKKAIAIVLTLIILSALAVSPAYAQTADTAAAVIGDVDGDTVVTIIDATFIQRYLLDIRLPFTYVYGTGDTDEDGDVTILDVTNLQRWLNNTGYRLNIGQKVIPWFDIADADPMDCFDGGFFYITRICQTHFFVSNDFGEVFRINGSISDQWSTGDSVYCSFDNIYYHNAYPYGAEADLLTIDYSWNVPDPYICYKPVIYLYPEEKTDVSVQLDLDGSFLYTKPSYEDGWNVTAAPDGTLTTQDGKTYPYLFWEGQLNTEYDFSTGFCVSGSESEAFLRESLATLGLNQSETDDFIDFWLPFMQKNPYNVISFQTAAYTDAAKLSISPQPDTTIRVFMAWYSSDEAVDIPVQTLPQTQRSGFTAVEWGGTYAARAPLSVSD